MKKTLFLYSLCISSFLFSQNQIVALDPAFANQGVMVTPFTSEHWAGIKIKRLSDGKILLITDDNLSGTNTFTINLSKYDSNGALDTTFGSNGYVRFTDIGDEYNYNIDDSGNTYVEGMTAPNGEIRVYKVNGAGQLDTSFGSSGMLAISNFISTGYYYQGLAIMPDGKILFEVKDSSGNYGVLRINANGSLDTSFGQNGFYSSGADRVATVQPSKDGNLFLVTTHFNGSASLDFIIKKMSSDLSTVIYSYTINTTDNGSEIFLNDDGNSNTFITSSKDDTPSESYIRKILPNGTLDPSFGINGIITETNVLYADIQTDSDGKILVAGLTQNLNTSDLNPIIKRYTASGVLDATFNLTGSKEEGYSGLDFFMSFAILPDGSIIGAGDSTNNLFMLKYNLTNQLSTAETALQKVGIYPNPVSNEFTLSIPKNEKLLNVQVFSVDGKLVYEGKSEKGNLSFLPKGMYVLKCRMSAGEHKLKFIKK